MTESFRSAVQLRNDICVSVADLKQRTTAILPDAASVFVTDTAAFYRLSKGLGNAYDALTGRIIVPADGSSNRWVQQEANGSSPWSGIEVLTAQNNINGAGSNVWAALGTTPGSFQLAAGDVTMFVVDPASSLMTYRGVPRNMLLTAVASILTAATDALKIVISRNSDVPAGSSATQYLKGEQGASTGDGLAVTITSQRSVFMGPGDTLRLMARSSNGAQQMQVNYFSLSVVPN